MGSTENRPRPFDLSVVGCNRGMNTAANATQVSSPSTRTVEENTKSLESVCHVVEVQAPYALVHASPNALARIIGELGFTVSPSKRGGDYYAVRVAAQTAPAPRPTHLSVAPPAPAPSAVRPVAAPQAPVATAPTAGRMNIGGTTYLVQETPCKRRIDVRRWEVRKVGDEIGKPYVVTFQAEDGSQTACSCKGGIFHKHCKHMDAFRAAYGRRDQSSVA